MTKSPFEGYHWDQVRHWKPHNGCLMYVCKVIITDTKNISDAVQIKNFTQKYS